ncbi:MAG: helicase-related protein, partial [Pseudonocardiaceae bacterium]
MIFSFFRGTLSYLDERLSEHFTTKVMTGGTKVPVRQEIMEAFRRGEFEVLLLSQVGSEGLDFEFCNVPVNYDLPWNPMQVEQRIGRIDRFGQTSEKIFIFNMHVPGTIESDIFDRLYNRIGLFESSIGELEPILRSELKQITASVLDPRLTAAQRSAETDRIAVALAKRAEEIRDLEQSRGALAAVDQLEIDGMTDNGPSNGRYVGPTEVRRLVETVVTSSGGKLSKPDSDGVCKLIGTDKLARALASTPRRRGGGVRTKQELAASFRDGDIVRVTFDNAVASKHDVELLSARHLLIDVALRSLDESRLSLHRYGSVAVPGAPPGRSFAVQIDLVHSSGLTPRVEFWATAVDLHTGQRDDAVGEQVLVALAEGELRDGPAPDSA